MRFIINILFLFFATSVLGQNVTNDEITVTGMIIEEGSNAPLEYATISFLNSLGKIVNGGITDNKGKYNIKIPAGSYTIQFEFISYETKQRTDQKLFKNTKLPTFALSVDK